MIASRLNARLLSSRGHRTIGCSEIGVPPSELSEHFGKLLEEEEEVGRDVVFSVEGESFAAHKLVLAARSPVFKAEFYGEMIERGTFSIDIKDMQTSVFRALLNFIYTDVLPADIGDRRGVSSSSSPSSLTIFRRNRRRRSPLPSTHPRVSKKKKTVSRHTTESEEGRHSFEIVGYSLQKGIGVDEFVESATFAVGGYDWCIRFYPDGKGDGAKDYISVYLELLTKDCAVRAAYNLRLVNLATGLPKSVYSETTHRMFNSEDSSKFAPHYATFMHRSQLEMEASGYIKDDRLTIECFLNVVVKESMASNTVKAHELIKVPPSDILENFGELLEKGEGADVTFVVGGEKIAAHKIPRSSVFKAELYGQMKEKRARRVTVEDMQPDVFRGLLHFIYTDSLPDMDDLSDDDYYEMIRLLLVAADRYAMDRMKLQCESILGEHLDVQTVATTLALADQHNCNGLKDVCIEFIATQNKMDDVVATEGYADLKRTCPSVLVDVFEKASKLRRI
uniref:BTB domain-containing protein n=1 Tax=Oryza glumipatula TaxID=40148 RepID=A0A0E0ASE3_9ORYZ